MASINQDHIVDAIANGQANLANHNEGVANTPAPAAAPASRVNKNGRTGRFPCTLCNTVVSRQDALVRHRRQIHQLQPAGKRGRRPGVRETGQQAGSFDQSVIQRPVALRDLPMATPEQIQSMHRSVQDRKHRQILPTPHFPVQQPVAQNIQAPRPQRNGMSVAERFGLTEWFNGQPANNNGPANPPYSGVHNGRSASFTPLPLTEPVGQKTKVVRSRDAAPSPMPQMPLQDNIPPANIAGNDQVGNDTTESESEEDIYGATPLATGPDDSDIGDNSNETDPNSLADAERLAAKTKECEELTRKCAELQKEKEKFLMAMLYYRGLAKRAEKA